MDEKMREYILYIMRGILGKKEAGFGHDWGRQFKHDQIFVALSLLTKHAVCGDGISKQRIIDWFASADFSSPTFSSGEFSFYDDRYLVTNLYFAIHNSFYKK